MTPRAMSAGFFFLRKVVALYAASYALPAVKGGCS